MKNTCDCIIPFYNEDERVVHVVESVLKVHGLTKIVVVDDGSVSLTSYNELKRKFPLVTSIRLNTNTGKAHAVKEGLKYVKSSHVLLLDADHTNIKIDEIENAIQKIRDTPEIDMIILRKIEDETVVVSRYIRHDTIFSGDRILKKNDLEKIYQKKFSDYQIEIAINTYMMRNKKKVYWMPFSAHSVNKWGKWGLVKGSKRGVDMFKGFVSYAGWKNFIWQTLFFCRKEAPKNL